MEKAPSSRGYSVEKEKLIMRMKRVEGQARGIRRMIEEDAYCIDILTQISAASSGMRAVALTLVDDHIRNCVVTSAKCGGEEGELRLAEVSKAIERLMRS